MSITRIERESFLGSLTEEEKRIIKKENPFRSQRNALIVKLARKGVKSTLLAEISGLSRMTICRLYPYYRGANGEKSKAEIDGEKLKRILDTFYWNVSKIVCQEKKGGEKPAG
jgi:hypothetical protein